MPLQGFDKPDRMAAPDDASGKKRSGTLRLTGNPACITTKRRTRSMATSWQV